MNFFETRQILKEDKIFGFLFLLILIVPLVFGYFTYEKFEIPKLASWMFFLGLGIFALCLGKIKEVALNKKVLWVLGAMLVFAFLSAFFSQSPINSWLWHYPRFTSSFLFYVVFALTLLVLMFVSNEIKLKIILWLVYFCAVVVALVGILQSMGIGFYEGINSNPAFFRAPGLLGNPNFTTMFLAAVLPLALPLFTEYKNFWHRIYVLLGVFFIVSTTIVLASRGGWLGVALDFLLIMFFVLGFGKVKKHFFSLLAICAIVLFGFFAILNLTRPESFKKSLNLSEVNINLRFYVWDIARSAIAENPFFGVGPGNFQNYFQAHRERNLASENGVYDDTHNLFLQIAATTGLPFLGLFLTLVGMALWSGYQSIKKTSDLQAVACFTGVASWLLMAFFNPVSIPNFLILIVFLVALLYPTFTHKIIFSNRVGQVLGKFVGVGFCFAGLLLISSEAIFYRGYLKYYANDFYASQKLIKTAIFLNPFNQVYFNFKSANDIFLGEAPTVLEKNVKKIIGLQPQDSKSYLIAAKLYFLQYDQTQNITYLEQAKHYMHESVKRDIFYPERIFRLAFYYAQSGQVSEALEFAKVGVSLKPTEVGGWLLLARIYQLLDRPKPMALSLEKAFKLNPTQPELRALWWLAKNKPDTYKQWPVPALIDTRNFEI